jgi:hypothetical protein
MYWSLLPPLRQLIGGGVKVTVIAVVVVVVVIVVVVVVVVEIAPGHGPGTTYRSVPLVHPQR